jgi:hypothetical protein
VSTYLIHNGLIGNSSGGHKKGVHGPLKGHSTAIKRIKSRCHKLPIQFSTRLGGPVGINHRSIVDEVVIFTRKRAPLIGVRSSKDIKQNVKEFIACDILVCQCSFISMFITK